ncbi:hypothetical protein BH708_18535 [Brachybacterium sp. P6-10-X1]|nr:hypothetical protein BH708_18535 [Brachybacterium sp. P6-10-X1]
MGTFGTPGPTTAGSHDALVERLRRAGCVFAEQEAELLEQAASDPQERERMCARREAGEFLEHVIGTVDICGEKLAVGPGDFVPRQRTALLIEAGIAEARRRRRPVVVEAYCGVAPVAALIGRRVSGARVHASDCDPRPLVHARANLPPGAGVHPGSGLDALPTALEGTVDLLVAVPPYVPARQWDLMPREAREHEPISALVAGRDGLEQVRHLLTEAPRWLAPGGVLLIEMHRDQAPPALAAAGRVRAYAECGSVAGEDGETVLVRARTPVSAAASAPIPAAVPAPSDAVRSVLPGPAPDLVLLRRVRDRIDRDHAQPWDVEMLARSVHLSGGHLSRRFREEYGESPYSYLMTRRIERAMALLRHTDRSVTDICTAVGFSSLGTFSTRFKELLGVSPSAYRVRGAEVLDSMPPCIARRVTRPIRNREAAPPGGV